jgi:hypothetical protein
MKPCDLDSGVGVQSNFPECCFGSNRLCAFIRLSPVDMHGEYIFLKCTAAEEEPAYIYMVS